MAVIPVIAPTIVRMSMHINLANGRHADCVLDISADVESGSREEKIPDVVDLVQDAWQTRIMPLVSGPFAYTGCSYVDLDSLDSVAGSVGLNGGLPDNAPSAWECPPPQVALLVTKVAHHTRSQRNGRLYLPGIQEAFIDYKGEIGGSYQASIQTAFNNFLNDVKTEGAAIASTNTALRVVHVTGHTDDPDTGKPRPSSWNSTDVTQLVVNARVGTIRRRNRP